MRTSWGPVVINKDEPISVGDVFNAVWEYLHKPITQSDWTAILESHGEQRRNRIAYAMYRRCQCAAALYDYMVSQGVKRVDLLEGSTVYWGTWLVYNVDYTWSLCMGFMPKGRMA
ncbi:uncharacterized protein FOMMEDRAFT_94733 [Fomitiporia mediterranea MF3/22]|uniref:uncharacterized protein n=1 Tax=Fomitiporia mediterranea (strain MF3/22) TaxID=694068 RepID=UPI00044098C3|nr:uncharacterized protein FOMMEDRAFT_94733 [Fomitiporia mediterranea MF3/22]EJC99168.1 hypothetical protein FOMMEDRAFT_94733 [Fomitiporia mediterranea MF3/22]